MSQRALVIGSGAGGAVTAVELARAGLSVTVLEEGQAIGTRGRDAITAMQSFYRKQGMTPIAGRVPIGYVEGACLGGSTEVNSGFWHRTPREILLRWSVRYGLRDAMPEQLAPHFAWAEEALGVGPHGQAWPKSTERFAVGARALGWSVEEVPRAAPGCQGSNLCPHACPTGAKRGMSQTLLPAAVSSGARIVTGARAIMVLSERDRVVGVLAEVSRPEGFTDFVRFEADHVFVCAGPTETPALLRRSGIRHRVGDSFLIHPMLKVVARFPERVDAHRSVMPLLQVKEFAPDISFGGAFFTPGHAAMMLSDNWPETRDEMNHVERLAAYYVAVKGTGRGHVRPSAFDRTVTRLFYRVSDEDILYLSKALARLSTLLLAAGAEAVMPTVYGVPPMRHESDAIRWLDERLPRAALSLSTVHAFSTCPMGEHVDRTAVDSFGKVRGYRNLYVNDASMLPDSPGVNPQGTVMAFARRNALHFLEPS